MNRIGMHIGYWYGSGVESSLDTMLELTRQAELDVIEFTPALLLQMTPMERKELRKKIESAGMKATINGGLDETNDLASDSPAVRSAGVEYCKRVLAAIPEVGADVWSGLNYSAWLRRPTEVDHMGEKARAQENSLNCMRDIIKTAEAVGVDYCFEVVNRFEQFLFNTSREAVDFAKAVASPRAKILLDTFHMNIEEDNIAKAILHAANEGVLGHLHIGESNRRIPGVGDTHMDWRAIGDALVQGNYQGALVMEPFVLTTAHNAKKICVWHDLSGMGTNIDTANLVKDAKTGGVFLRGIVSKSGRK